MRALVIEDDIPTADSLNLVLKSKGGFVVDVGYDAHEGVDLAKVYEYDVIVLGLPSFGVIRDLRHHGIETPILVLTHNIDVGEKLRAFSFGADDIMTKPYNSDELIARVRAIVRRSHGHAQSIVTVGDLTINLDEKTVEAGGERVRLTTKEYQMVELMALRRGATITKGMFMNHLYGGMDEPELKIIDVFICKLRRKLGRAADHIETTWGRGYSLRAPETAAPSLAPEISDMVAA